MDSKSLLKSVIFLALGISGMSAIYHAFGTLHSRKDSQNNSLLHGKSQLFPSLHLEFIHLLLNLWIASPNIIHQETKTRVC